MKRTHRLLSVLVFLSACRTAPAPRPTADPAGLDSDAIMSLMKRVADWQIAHPSKHKPYDWTQGAYYTGMMALAELSRDGRYLDAMRAMAQQNAYRPGPRPTHADDHAVVQTYAQIYLIDRDPRMLAPSLELFDRLVTLPFSEPLTWGNEIHDREWAWCDSLFMSPPALVLATRATGDRKYLDLMNRLWWKTTDYLYDKDERLYFRDSRFFDPREPNGRKVFWSRGNGWVLAGLTRVLQHLPADYPERPRYEALYLEMAKKLASLQGADGFWRSSLLDPDKLPNPESSGTGFFVHGLAWGINTGRLDVASYLPVVQRGWRALVGAVKDDGKLGFVQRIGDQPGATSPDSTEVYGVGAFLLAGSELFKLSLRPETRAVITVRNPLDVARFDETLELDWKPLAGSADAQNVAVIDGLSNAILPVQLFDDGGGSPRLLVQAHFLAGESRRFRVVRLQRPFAPPVPNRSYGRFVPERLDDIAWENDRIAFRMYGPALEKQGEVSSGIDVWVKRVRHPVIDGWYRSGDYHEDHGEGLDGYKVGPTLGCGGIGVWQDERLFTSRNYARGRILADGPIRVAFELEYDSWGPEGHRFKEIKRIQLDRGHHLNRVEVELEPDASPKTTLAAGIVKRVGAGRIESQGKWLSYWEPETPGQGHTGCAVVLPHGAPTRAETADHVLLLSPADGGGFVYHAGASWSEGLDVSDATAWAAHVAGYSRRLETPVELQVEKVSP